jgi:hypothetical protein
MKLKDGAYLVCFTSNQPNNTSDSFVIKLSKNSADLKPVSTALNKFKKRKNLFSFRFISASQSLGHLGRMSGARCDLDER